MSNAPRRKRRETIYLQHRLAVARSERDLAHTAAWVFWIAFMVSFAFNIAQCH